MRPRRRYPRIARWIPSFVLFFALGTTTIGSYIYRQLVRESDTLAFQSVAFQTESDIDDRLKSIVNPAVAAAAYIGTSHQLTKSGFADFLDRAGWRPGSDDIKVSPSQNSTEIGMPAVSQRGGTVGFSIRMPASRLAELNKLARDAGDDDFVPHPMKGVDFIDAVLFFEPHRDYSGPPGSNFYSDPDRRAAMDRAIVTGTLTATRPTKFKKGTPETGIVVFIPVFEHGTPAKLADRERKLAGFTYSGIRVGEAITDYFQRGQIPCTVSVYDGGQPDAGTRLFSNDPATGEWPYDAERPYNGLGRPWYIVYHPNEAFFRTRSQIPIYLVPIGGLCLSLLLFMVTSTLQRARVEAEQFALDANQRALGQGIQARTSTLLTSSFDWRQGLAGVADLLVPAFADACTIDLQREDGTIERAAAAHTDPTVRGELASLEARYPSDPDATEGIPAVIRDGKYRVYAEVTPELVMTGNEAEERKQVNMRLGVTSAIVAPIRARGKSFGALTVAEVHHRRSFTKDDAYLIDEIAGRIGLAIENSRLFESAQSEIVERAKAEERVHQLNEDLESLVEMRTRDLQTAMQELEAFCYSVSHDLRAPLRSVDGFTKALLEEYGERLDADGIGYLNRVRNASRRMDELITALLTLSRLTRAEINPQPVDLSAIALSLTEEYDPEHKAEFSVEPDLTASGDPRMMRALLDNLIGNAFKFSSKVEHPRIEFGRRGGAFFVQDNGAGFNPLYAGKLFRPFERLHTDREFPGSGIGLATAARIVRRHGGTIWADSQVDGGATFSFTIEDGRGAG